MDQIKHNILNPPISHNDSINNVLNAMQLKIDNLEKIVVKTEIGTSFFWSVIGLQLAVFVVLVGIGGWISWGFFGRILSKHKAEINSNVTENVNILKSDIEILTSNLNDTIYHTSRAMYWNAMTHNAPEISRFQWSISIVCAYKACRIDENDGIETWLSKSLEHVKNLGHSDISRHENHPQLKSFLELKFELEPNQKLWAQVRSQIYSKLITPTESTTAN